MSDQPDNKEQSATLVSPNEFLPNNQSKKIEITDQEKDAFFRAFMTDTAYEKSYPLFGGRSSCVLQAMTNEQNSSFYKKLQKDKEEGLFNNSDAYMTKLTCYRLCAMLVSVGDVVMTGKSDDEKLQLFLSWPTFKLATVFGCLEEFDLHLIHLSAQTADPSFWKAAK